MELVGSYRLKAPREEVWDALGDPSYLQRNIPGCTTAERLPNGDMRLVVDVEVGPFTATFTGQYRLESFERPSRATVSGEGRGRPAGSAHGRAEVTLTEEQGITTLRYEGTAEVGGRLGEIDPGLVSAKARQLADSLFGELAAEAKREDEQFVDRIDHPPAGVPILGDEPSERIVEDPAERAGEIVREVEEEIEVAAGRNFLGGPMVWGTLVLLVLVAAFLIFR